MVIVTMLRQLNKIERKEKILDRVEDLIVIKKSTEFTMQELASHVGISPTTFYNIFGSKGAVLYGLLNRGLGKIVDGRRPLSDEEDPVAYAIESMTFAADIFIKRSDLYRPLYKFQLAEHDMPDRGSYLEYGLDYWKRSIQGLVELGYLSAIRKEGFFCRDDVALALLTHSSGVIDLWVHGNLTNSEFRARMTHDAALIVSAVVPIEARSGIYKLLEKSAAQLKKFSFSDAPVDRRSLPD